MEHYKSVYVNPDLTEAERLDDYELRRKRDELNGKRADNEPFRYAIRGNNVVKLKIQTGGGSAREAATN